MNDSKHLKKINIFFKVKLFSEQYKTLKKKINFAF